MRPKFRYLPILIAAGVMLPFAPTPAAAATTTSTTKTAQSAGTLTQQLNQAQQQLTKLNDQVERAGAAVDTLNRQLTTDVARGASLRQRLNAMARLEYQRPALSLTLILSARTLDELISGISQARLVAGKQQGLIDQTRQLHQRDQQARDQAAAELSRIQASRDAASKLAAHLQAMVQSARNSQLGQTLAMAIAVGGRGTPPGRWPNHFAFGFCTYYVATRRYIPFFGNAGQWIAAARAAGFAEGSAPRVGAVMVTAESSVGHVAYVEAVNADGSWTVSEMNFKAWDVVDRRTIHPGQVPLVSPGFIY
jgi:surface antigen